RFTGLDLTQTVLKSPVGIYPAAKRTASRSRNFSCPRPSSYYWTNRRITSTSARSNGSKISSKRRQKQSSLFRTTASFWTELPIASSKLQVRRSTITAETIPITLSNVKSVSCGRKKNGSSSTNGFNSRKTTFGATSQDKRPNKHS